MLCNSLLLDVEAAEEDDIALLLVRTHPQGGVRSPSAPDWAGPLGDHKAQRDSPVGRDPPAPSGVAGSALRFVRSGPA